MKSEIFFIGLIIGLVLGIFLGMTILISKSPPSELIECKSALASTCSVTNEIIEFSNKQTEILERSSSTPIGKLNKLDCPTFP